MSDQKGYIVLMGSGELTATMVDVHKDLLAALPGSGKAVFLDTPAGFQLNVDQISQRAVEYFRTRIQHPLAIASFKGKETVSTYEAEQAFHTLREAKYTLIGPGSPSYAVNQWLSTPIPKILVQSISTGGCLVAASAAALTVGRYTLPVYEIYKVGQDLHWMDGMNILDAFGFNLIVIPHWNNAEGGTHDTRFCFMGESRFNELSAKLPADVSILGLDEHTACILDLAKGEGQIRGIGRVILKRSNEEIIFKKGDIFSLDIFSGKNFTGKQKSRLKRQVQSATNDPQIDDSFWDGIHRLEAIFQEGHDQHDPQKAIHALLEIDQMIWKAQKDLESEEFISQAREIFREFIVLMGTILQPSPRLVRDNMAPLVEELLKLRETFRQKKMWENADMIRDSLHRAGITVEDTINGSEWRMSASENSN